MYRKDSLVINDRLNNSNKALLVIGPRQVGKTWMIRDEIKKNKYRLFEINFIDQPDMITYLNSEMSVVLNML